MKTKTETMTSIYTQTIKDSNLIDRESINDLNSLIKIDPVKRCRNIQSASQMVCNRNIDIILDKTDLIKDTTPGKMSNVISIHKRNTNTKTKTKTKITPLSLLGFPDRRTQRPASSAVCSQQIAVSNKKNKNSNPYEVDILKLKSAYVIKFANNAENFQKICKSIQGLSELNRKYASECYSNLQAISEEKDRVLFNCTEIDYHSWKKIITVFYEFEMCWHRMCEIILKEMKSEKDTNLHLAKKCNDQENLLVVKNAELFRLQEYIADNDINYKSMFQKKKAKDLNELNEGFLKKENMYRITIHRLEEEIRDLTSLCAQNKEISIQYDKCLEKLEEKNKELEDLRIRFNSNQNEKIMKIAYMKTEKHELNTKLVELQQEVTDGKFLMNVTEKEQINHITQVKILMQSITEKNENIKMLTEEIDTWANELYKERMNHYKTQQTVKILEMKLNKEKANSIIQR